MGWVSSHRRFGARFALIALAVQIVLSFGHVHLHGIGTSSHHAVAASHKVTAQNSQQIPAQNNPSDDDDYCAICASIFLASTSFVSTPPLLPVPLGFQRIEHSFAVARVFVTPRRALFQSRAPPAA